MLPSSDNGNFIVHDTPLLTDIIFLISIPKQLKINNFDFLASAADSKK